MLFKDQLMSPDLDKNNSLTFAQNIEFSFDHDAPLCVLIAALIVSLFAPISTMFLDKTYFRLPSFPLK